MRLLHGRTGVPFYRDQQDRVKPKPKIHQHIISQLSQAWSYFVVWPECYEAESLDAQLNHKERGQYANIPSFHCPSRNALSAVAFLPSAISILSSTVENSLMGWVAITSQRGGVTSFESTTDCATNHSLDIQRFRRSYSIKTNSTDQKSADSGYWEARIEIEIEGTQGSRETLTRYQTHPTKCRWRQRS